MVSGVELFGAERVAGAGHAISGAAERISGAASTFDSSVRTQAQALYDHEIFLNGWLERFEAAASDPTALRDLFAAHALNGILGCYRDLKSVKPGSAAADRAKAAYDHADAMMVERAKRAALKEAGGRDG